MEYYFEWDSRFELGIKTIDDQHRYLVDLVNRAYIALEEGYGLEFLLDMLEKLIEYCTYHFHYEEQLMKFRCYPDLDAHLQEHRIFSDRVLQYLKRIQSTGDINFMEDIANFIKTWFIHHICLVDLKLKPLFENEGK